MDDMRTPRQSLDPIVLLKIVLAAKDLYILGVFRRTALRVGDDVVEVQTGVGTAFLALALVALPHFELYPTWNDSVIFQYRVGFTWQDRFI